VIKVLQNAAYRLPNENLLHICYNIFQTTPHPGYSDRALYKAYITAALTPIVTVIELSLTCKRLKAVTDELLRKRRRIPEGTTLMRLMSWGRAWIEGGQMLDMDHCGVRAFESL